MSHNSSLLARSNHFGLKKLVDLIGILLLSYFLGGLWLALTKCHMLIHSGNTYLECVKKNISFMEYFYEVLGRFYCTSVMIFGCSHNLISLKRFF